MERNEFTTDSKAEWKIVLFSTLRPKRIRRIYKRRLCQDGMAAVHQKTIQFIFLFNDSFQKVSFIPGNNVNRSPLTLSPGGRRWRLKKFETKFV